MDDAALYFVCSIPINASDSGFKVSVDHCASWKSIGHFYWSYPMLGPYLSVDGPLMALYAATMANPNHVTVWVSTDGGVSFQDVMPAAKGEYLQSVSGLHWDKWVARRLWISTPDRSVVVLDV